MNPQKVVVQYEGGERVFTAAVGTIGWRITGDWVEIVVTHNCKTIAVAAFFRPTLVKCEEDEDS